MISVARALFPDLSRQVLWRFLLVTILLATQTGCATSDADLDYTRQTTPDATQDHSYHGWNNANY